VFIDEIWKTKIMDNHTLTWPTKPENFMRFGTTCVFCGRDPMEYLTSLSIPMKIKSLEKKENIDFS